MKESTETQNLSSYFALSLGLHVGIIGGILLLSWAIHYFNIPIPLLSNKSDVILAQTAVRVDIVSMPKMTLKELENMTPSGEEGKKEEPKPEPTAAPIKEEPKPDEEAYLKEKQQRQKSFADMLKEMSKKKIDKKKMEQLKGMKGELNQLLLAGNKISKGTSTTGVTQEQLNAFSSYISRLPDHVRRYWRLPGYLANQDLKCRIRVYLSQNGDLIKAQIYEGSGNEEYDRLALQAVRSASPFPEVASEIREQVLAGNILLGFPL